MLSLFEADEPVQKILQQTWERCETDITHLNIRLDPFKQHGC